MCNLIFRRFGRTSYSVVWSFVRFLLHKASKKDPKEDETASLPS
jgi:hypothetical protein